MVINMINDECEKWKQELDLAYNECDDLSKEIKTLMEIIIYTSFGEKIGRLYKIINDSELFSKLINEFEKSEIIFPSKDEFVECVMTSVIYYYKEVLGFDWDKIQKMLPYENDIRLRYTRKIKKLENKIKIKLQCFEKNKNIEDIIFD